MTYHLYGGTNSADLFHEADGLDLDMVQSGHRRPDRPNYEFMLENLGRTLHKPTLDGELRYEDQPIKGDIWNRRNRSGVPLP